MPSGTQHLLPPFPAHVRSAALDCLLQLCKNTDYCNYLMHSPQLKAVLAAKASRLRRVLLHV